MTASEVGSEVKLVLTTEGDVTTASRLAQELLDRRVIACAALIPVRSLYHWEGTIEDVEEVQLQLKTTEERLPDLLVAIAELHSYDLPEVLVVEAEASLAYQGWVNDSVAPLP